ncbi:hypothetical protein K1719_014480 [Acacia pycnantha]|nr:hypothetical protein K1719_014480 [Acacia pycnantha]
MGNSCRKPIFHVSSSNISGKGKSQSEISKNSNSSDGKAASQTLGPTIGGSISSSLKSFSFSDLREATRNFRQENLIGEGGFGFVYKGWIDENSFAPTRPGSGIMVAIKKLKPESFQGHKEWLAEVNYLGQLHHENVVKLIGYCSEGKNRLLVYEFMQRGSLENHLFRKGVQPISWAARIDIAAGVARGLAFLHTLDTNVIYRDLKASNVLLDSDFNPKLSDFGLARDGPSGGNTHVSTRVIGTQGYAAPEYVATGHLTPRSDVYSFGVVLLELLTGRRVVEAEKPGNARETLVDWAMPFLKDGKRISRVMDLRLCGQYPKKGALAAGALAYQCLNADPKYRPTMISVLAKLEELHSSNTTIPSTPPKSESRNHTSKHAHHSLKSMRNTR